MNRTDISVLEPIFRDVANVSLVEAAARDLEGSDEESPRLGHVPSWESPRVPDGFALCVGCWRLITARQLGRERCSGAARRAARYCSDERLGRGVDKGFASSLPSSPS